MENNQHLKVRDILNLEFRMDYQQPKISFINLRNNVRCLPSFGLYNEFNEIPETYHDYNVIGIYPGDRNYFNLVIEEPKEK